MDKLKILFIDQHVYANKWHKKAYEEELGTVTQVQYVDDAVREIMSEKKYDLIISELVLPWGTNGLEYVAHQSTFEEYSYSQNENLAGLNLYYHYIKEHQPQAKTIFVTSCFITKKFADLGLTYFKKPCLPTPIIDWVKQNFAQPS